MKPYRSSYLVFLILLTCVTINTFSQVGIGTTSPDASAQLEVSSNTKGLLIPRMTQAQRTNISFPAQGLMVYQTDGIIGLYQYDGTSWSIAGAGSSIYSTNGTLSGNRTVSAGGYTLTLSPKSTFNPSVTASSLSAIGTEFTPILTAASNNDVLLGININPTFSKGAFTGIGSYGLQVEGIKIGRGGGSISTNVAIGNNALIKNTTGNNQVVIGYESGKEITSGMFNTIIGSNTLKALTTGNSNTVLGANNLNSSTNGSNNYILGTYSMSAATSASSNIAIGQQVLLGLTTGTNNIAMGNYAANGVTDGQQNVSIGQMSLYWCNSSQNIGIGYRAGFDISSGSSNTCIGYSANVANGTYSNSTALGNGATAGGSNWVQLGNSSVTTIRGAVAYSSSSDRRLKQNISDTRYGLKEVMKLRPVDYVMTSNQVRQVGFIAQDVQPLIPEIVTGSEGDISKGETLAITYANMVAILTKAIQEQQAMIEQLKLEIEALKKRR